MNCIHSILIIVSLLFVVNGQYSAGTPQFKESMLVGKATLEGSIQSNPDLQYIFDPSSVLIDNSYYVNDFPLPEYYRISLAVDPCRNLTFNCCLNVFGTPEYPALIKDGREQERVVKYTVLGNDDVVQINYQAVYEDSALIPATSLRSADDDAMIDLTCTGLATPHDYCYGKNYAFRRSSFRPNCTDNNNTLNTLSGCLSPIDGSYHKHCVQVGYSQNAFIGICKDSQEVCGTYLEIHMVQGSPYQSEEDVIGEILIENRNVSGMYTTMLPLTWMGNHTKVLCSYTETFLRVGSSVYILPEAPKCCCPKPFTTTVRQGSFFCPKGASGNGPYAAHSTTISQRLIVDELQGTFPYCHSDLDSIDRLMCGRYGIHDRRFFTLNCSDAKQLIPKRADSWGSDDLQGFDYNGQCPYFSGCALSTSGKCIGKDLLFTFVGQTGRIVALDDSSAVPYAWVTFNDGRTAYLIEQQYLQLEYRKRSMYEVWWVLRTKTHRVVQKRKGFNVTSPRCTFDLTNNRYFPFAELDNNGNEIDSAFF